MSIDKRSKLRMIPALVDGELRWMEMREETIRKIRKLFEIRLPVENENEQLSACAVEDRNRGVEKENGIVDITEPDQRT